MQTKMIEEVIVARETRSTDKTKWTEIIAEWERGNESQKTFCARKELNLNTFTYWRGKLLSRNQHETKKSNFVPVTVKINEKAQPTIETFTIENTNGVKLRLPLSIEASKLEPILRLMGFIYA